MKFVTFLLIFFKLFFPILTDAQVGDKNYFETTDVAYDRNKCFRIPVIDSIKTDLSNFASGLSKDTSFYFEEEGKDSLIVFRKKGNKTSISGFYAQKKVSGDYYEITGYKNLNNFKSDTISQLWKSLFITLSDTNSKNFILPRKESLPSIKLIGLVGKNWVCYYNSAELKYDYPNDARSKFFFLVERYYRLIRF